MQSRYLLFAALSSAVVMAAMSPAYADNDWRNHQEHAQDMRDHHDRDRRDYDRGYYAPPVVVSPPAYGGYYASPPLAYGPPGVTLGITIR